MKFGTFKPSGRVEPSRTTTISRYTLDQVAKAEELRIRQEQRFELPAKKESGQFLEKELIVEPDKKDKTHTLESMPSYQRWAEAQKQSGTDLTEEKIIANYLKAKNLPSDFYTYDQLNSLISIKQQITEGERYLSCKKHEHKELQLKEAERAEALICQFLTDNKDYFFGEGTKVCPSDRFNDGKEAIACDIIVELPNGQRIGIDVTAGNPDDVRRKIMRNEKCPLRKLEMPGDEDLELPFIPVVVGLEKNGLDIVAMRFDPKQDKGQNLYKAFNSIKQLIFNEIRDQVQKQMENDAKTARQREYYQQAWQLIQSRPLAKKEALAIEGKRASFYEPLLSPELARA